MLAATLPSSGVRRQAETVIERSAFCRVVSVEPGSGPVRRVKIDRGAEDGVVLQWRGTARSIWSKERDSGEIGDAVVVALQPREASVAVTLTKPAGNGVIRSGDVIELPIRIPKKPERSILWRMALLDIRFTSIENAPTYNDFRALYAAETAAADAKTMQAMVEDIHLAGRLYGNTEALQKAREKGRYKGRSTTQVMLATTPEMLRNFLQYVSDFPGKYYGHDWKIAETFATWVLNDAPAAAEELSDQMLAAPTDAERDRLVQENRDDILKHNVLISWVSRAEKLAEDRRIDDALRLAEIVIKYARVLKRPVDERWGIFARASVLQERSAKEGLPAYTLAFQAFRAVPKQGDDELKGIAFSLHNRGKCYLALGRYREALADFTAAISIKSTHAFFEATSVGGSYWQQGYAHEMLANYPQALASYQLAEAQYRKAADTSGLMDVLLAEASVAAKLGKNAAAEQSYSAVLATRRREGDRKGEATVLEKLGYHRWKLGRYKEALGSYEAALELRTKLADRKSAAADRTSIGKLQWNLGDLTASLVAHTAALEERRALGDRSGQAESLGELGDVYRKTGDNPRAAESYGEARKLYHDLAEREGEAGVLEKLAQLQLTRNEKPDALRSLEQAVALHRQSGARAALGGALREHARILLQMAEIDRALKEYSEAIDIARATHAASDEANVLLGLASAWWQRGKLPVAQQHVESALKLADQIADGSLQAQCSSWLAKLLTAQYQFPRAAAAYGRALARYRSTQVADRENEASTLLDLGDLRSSQGAYRASLAQYEAGRALGEKIGARPLVRRALTSIGWTQLTLGNLDAGFQANQQAVELARQVNDDQAIADSLQGLSSAYDDLAQYAKSIEIGEQALALFRKTKNNYGIAAILNNTAGAFDNQGDYVEAERRITESLQYAQKDGDQTLIAGVLGTTGQIKFHLNKWDEALLYFRRALAVSRKIDYPRFTQNILCTQAATCRKFAEVKTKAHDTGAAAKLITEAKAAAAEAEQLAKRMEAPGALAAASTQAGNIAFYQRDFATAKAILTRAAQTLERVKAPILLSEALFDLSRAQEAMGDLSSALASRRRAVDILEKMRGAAAGGEKGQENFLRSRVQVYEAMANLLGRINMKEKDPDVRKARAEEMLRYVSLARFQILSNRVRDVHTGDAELDKLREQYTATAAARLRQEQQRSQAEAQGNRQQAAALDEVLATTDRDLARVYVRLKTAEESGRRLRVAFDPRWISRSEQVKNLPEHGTLAVLFPSSQALHVWLFNRNGFQRWVQHPVDQQTLFGLIDEFRHGVEEVMNASGRRQRVGSGFGPAAEQDQANPAWYRDNIRTTRHALEELYRHLIGPIEKEVDASDPLLIMPYGKLCYLPFEALMKPAAAGAPSVFLGQKKQICYFVSEDHLRSTLEAAAKPTASAADRLVAFADPRGRLPSSLAEAREIAGFFPHQELFSHDQATPDQVRHLPADATIVHFATHGFLNSDDPIQTFLEMAPGESRLVQANVYEFNDLPCFRQRHVRLVTLSACETARGQSSPEAEVLGMPDAFSYAGASSVLASLWSVDTYKTTDLMVEFYRLLAKSGTDKASALKQARESIITGRNGRYAHPYFWAPFVLFGDWR